MEYKKFASTWLSLQASNQFMKMVCLCLMALNLVALIGWMKKDNVVILMPPGLSEKAEISKNKASEGYKKSWAMYTATLIGNVTPENADFVLESFSVMVTGDIRALITEQVAQELETLKQEKVSSVFEIIRVTYEPESDKVFVTGRNRMIGGGGKSTPTDQTFEFRIDVKQYSPIITSMAAYKGGPRLKDFVIAEETKKRAEEEKQKPAMK
jgi:conjugal transfer pilus assembly protein TraE